MSRFNFDKLGINDENCQPVNPMQGKSFLEILLQESAGEEIPEGLFDEPLGEMPIPDRKKRFKFLRFPKLKAMLDQLDQTAEKTDAYVIMDENDSKEEIEKEVRRQLEQEQRDDTTEFLNDIEHKLKFLGQKGRKETRQENNAKKDEAAFEASILKSIIEDDKVVSETLANLLAAQGKKNKAIKMYKALSLKFPEKSCFFAHKIENLK